MKTEAYVTYTLGRDLVNEFNSNLKHMTPNLMDTIRRCFEESSKNFDEILCKNLKIYGVSKEDIIAGKYNDRIEIKEFTTKTLADSNIITYLVFLDGELLFECYRYSVMSQEQDKYIMKTNIAIKHIKEIK